LSDCLASSVTVNEHAPIREIERAISEAKQQKEAACSDLNEALKKRERALSGLKAAFDSVGSDIAGTFSRVQNRTSGELNKLKDQISSLQSIPNDPNDLNNQRLKEVGRGYSNSLLQIAGLDKNWDLLFLPISGGSTDQIVKAIGSEDLPDEAKGALSDFLDRLPPFLIGKGPAPRQQIEFIKAQSVVVKQSIALKDERYSRQIRVDAGHDLRAAIQPEAISSFVFAVRKGVIDGFGYQDVGCIPGPWIRNCSTWAIEARSSGACQLARDKVDAQLKTISAAVENSPEEIKNPLSQTFQAEVSERKRFLNQTSCHLESDLDLLDKSLGKWHHVIGEFCKASAPDLQILVSGLLLDIDAYAKIRPTIVNVDDLRSARVIGERLWDRGYYLSTACAGGSQ
jgi:hypothetical protein